MKHLLHLLLLLACLTLTCCKATQMIPVQNISADSTYRVIRERDSIYIKDSIYIDIQRGQDTVYRYETKWRTIYKDVFRVDTFYVTERDSIPYMVEVEKKLNRWEQVKQTIGGYAILLILAFVAIKLIVAKFRKGL